MSNLTILRQYAGKAASALPNSVLFQSSDKFYTIFDAYPKSIFHFLILPRILEGDAPGFSVAELRNLKSLLKTDKERSKVLIEELRDEAHGVKKQIEDEMVERYGFKWDVWIGFHASPSMEHLHLHVLSADLVSERMKNKKHYNSFHPSLGFFLHVDDVLEWFDSTPDYFQQVSGLNVKKYEDLLKEGLECFRCGASMKNMPTLKAHLQQEWDKQEVKAKSRQGAKRKVVEDPERSDTQPEVTHDTEDDSPTKKVRVD